MDRFDVGAPVAERYEAKRVIARGGVCIITQAEHRFTGRQVVIKQLDHEWHGHAGARERLLREARLLEQARHPNVVDVLDAGIDDTKQPYLVMEHLVGRPLAGLLTSRRVLAEDEVVAVGLDLCGALGAVHDKGILHRDVKSSNVMLVRNPSGTQSVKLIDFGIAGTRTSAGPAQPGLTEPGEVLGTPQYMAPELLQMEGDASPRADVYSLGVVLYECLTGKTPFEGNYGSILVQVCTSQPAHPRDSQPNGTPSLHAVVMKALSRKPGDRYADMPSLAEALQRSLEPSKATAPGPAGAAAPPALPSFPVPPVQRRRYVRQAYVTLVRITQDDGVVLDGRSEDISEGGMLVLTERACQDGMKATIRFALPLSGRIVTVASELRWVRTGRGRVAAGLQFEGLETEAQIEVGRYVALMTEAGDGSG